jgi:hypothetical protein
MVRFDQKLENMLDHFSPDFLLRHVSGALPIIALFFSVLLFQQARRSEGSGASSQLLLSSFTGLPSPNSFSTAPFFRRENLSSNHLMCMW